MQAKLDKIDGTEPDYQIIEEGLGVRTAGNIDLDKLERNGLEYFQNTIIPNIAFDIGITALGTNDLKAKYDRSAQQIYNDLIQYQELVRLNLPPKTKLIFILPPSISKSVVGFDDYHQKLLQLASLFKEGVTNKLSFIDLSGFKVTGADGLHFSIQDHQKVVEIVYDKLISLGL